MNRGSPCDVVSGQRYVPFWGRERRGGASEHWALEVVDFFTRTCVEKRMSAVHVGIFVVNNIKDLVQFCGW